jgi:hypothetical protein
MTDIIDGNAVAADVRDGLGDAIDTLDDAGVTPTLATVLMSDDPASQTYVSMKQQDCEEVGIEALDVEIDPDAPAEELFDTVAELNADPDVNGILVQMPGPSTPRRTWTASTPRTSAASSPATPSTNRVRPTASSNSSTRPTWRPRAPTWRSSVGRTSSANRSPTS